LNVPEIYENGSYSITIETNAANTFSGNINIELWDDTNINSEIKQTSLLILPFNTANDFQFVIKDQIPDIKIIDFLTGLFKLFNLTAYYQDESSTVGFDSNRIWNTVNEYWNADINLWQDDQDVTQTQGRKIMVKTLDAYYADSQTTWDITEYVNTEEKRVTPTIPFNRIEFGYTGLETLQANKHYELFDKEWGTATYAAIENEAGTKYEVKAPFEHMKYERLIDTNGVVTDAQVGWFVNKDKSSTKGKPLLFYPKKITGGTFIAFRDNETSVSALNTYYIPLNSVDTEVDSQTLNYYAEYSEYGSVTNGSFSNMTMEETLFKTYYKNYIESVFDLKRRVVKVSAKMPLKFLLNYSLADKITVFNEDYFINKINTDLRNGDSRLELIPAYITTSGDGSGTTTTTTTTTAAPTTTTAAPTTTTTTAALTLTMTYSCTYNPNTITIQATVSGGSGSYGISTNFNTYEEAESNTVFIDLDGLTQRGWGIGSNGTYYVAAKDLVDNTVVVESVITTC